MGLDLTLIQTRIAAGNHRLRPLYFPAPLSVRGKPDPIGSDPTQLRSPERGRCLMDSEEEKLPVALDGKTTNIFSKFMLRCVRAIFRFMFRMLIYGDDVKSYAMLTSRITRFGELVDRAHRFLIGFYQELETFRRPHLYKKSKVVDQIIGDNQTNRMKAYIEAGCRHRHHDIQNISKLNSSIQKLQNHLLKVKVLLDQLECLKQEAIGIAQEVSQRPTQILDTCISDEECHPLEEEDTVESIHLQDKSIFYATLMAVIYNMFRLDYTMQENIINSVNLASTTSEQLENYCPMWNLRPYINNNVMRQSWKLVS